MVRSTRARFAGVRIGRWGHHAGHARFHEGVERAEVDGIDLVQANGALPIHIDSVREILE
ncbi:hypothetical protein [Comamonas serinivorans]|uniref:hypothetical protein n=1 Tax=Comamonas serinivorans TaxID=1082851 RepID=UPI0012F946D3|nr:hypothetical protein [Comamonas serinivorans]